MKNQRGFVSPIAGLLLVVLIAVVLIGRNATTSSNILKYKMESNETDLAYSLDSIAMSMSNTSGIDFNIDTDLVDTDSLRISIDDYINVVDLDNPNRLMLTSNLTTGAFNKTDSKYEIINSSVYKNLNLNLYPKGKDILDDKGVGRVGSYNYSFQSNIGSKFAHVNIGGKLFDKENPSSAQTGINLATHSNQDRVDLNDYEGVTILYPTKVGDDIVEGNTTFK